MQGGGHFHPWMLTPAPHGSEHFSNPGIFPNGSSDLSAMASWLIGTWTGTGKASFSNMGGEEFHYAEEASFVPVAGRSAITYSQRTWRNGDTATLHMENGFLRLGAMAGGNGRAQLLVSQVTGLNYVCEGEVGDFGLDLQSVQFSSVCNYEGPTITIIRRRFFPRGDGSVGYTVDFSTAGEAELVRCLEATLLPMPPHMASAPDGSQVQGGMPMGYMPAMHGGGMGPVGEYPMMMGDIGALKGRATVPTPPRKDWGRVLSEASGKFVVEVHRDKFDGDSIGIQCREKDKPWNRSAWIPCTFVDAMQVKHKVIQVSFEDKTVGKAYEIRAKVMGGQPTTLRQGGTLHVTAGDQVVTEGTLMEETEA